MQENWEIGRRKSFAVDALSGKKEDDQDKPEKKSVQKKQRRRSQSLTWGHNLK